jgi:YesN/AraC family two-component response regulator
MRALIVDDERLARNELRRLLGRHPEIEIVGEAASAPQARKAFEDLEPDVLFLDVQMPEESGFDLIASLDSVPLVVFTTAYDEYALRAFEVSALDFLVKPVESKRLAATVARLLVGASRTPTGVETTTERLRRLVKEELCGGNPTLEHLAARLHMSARTLHRRLGEEGTSFRRVVKELRRELAERHLRERRLAIGEIGFLLGFSEVSAFHRAFKRWTGWPPFAYRRARARANMAPREPRAMVCEASTIAASAMTSRGHKDEPPAPDIRRSQKRVNALPLFPGRTS